MTVSFVVAVLALIIAGFSYLGVGIAGYSYVKLVRTKLKAVLLGFILILIGWVVITTVGNLLGFYNKDKWWQVDCQIDNVNNANNETAEEKLTTFPNLADFISSNEKFAKIIDNTASPQDLENELSNLVEGEKIQFYAPIQLDSSKKNGFISLLTVKKEDGQIKLENVGEYWSALQAEWPKISSQVGDQTQKTNLDRILGNRENLDNYSLIQEDGQGLASDSLASLYDEIVKLDQTRGYKEIDSNLSDLVTSALKKIQESNPQQASGEIANLLANVLTASKSLGVIKTGDGGQEDSQNCSNSGGSWTDSECDCSSVGILKSDGKCYAREEKKDSDEDGISDSEDVCPNTPAGQNTEVNKDKNSKNYGCNCSEIIIPQKQCQSDGCLGQNWQTYPKGVQECANGALLPYSCASIQSSASQACANKNINSPSLPNIASSLNKPNNGSSGIENKKGGDPGGGGSSPGSGGGNSGSGGGKSDNNCSSCGNKGNGGNSGTSGNADNGTNSSDNSSGAGNPSADSGEKWEEKLKVNCGSSFAGNPTNVKNALKEICKHDKLRYKMIFHYVKDILSNGNRMGGGGQSTECGCLTVGSGNVGDVAEGNSKEMWGMDLGMDILHEATHTADDCLNTRSDERSDSWEAKAVANSWGSATLPEFAGQTEQVKNKSGKEVRGFGARLEKEGYLNKYPFLRNSREVDLNHALNPPGYAKRWSNTGTYPYVNGQLLLDNQSELELKNIMEKMPSTCMSSPPADLVKEGCDVDECKGRPEMKIR